MTQAPSRRADLGKRKTAEERADDERRYALARAARTDEDFETLLVDLHQGIRSTAVANRSAGAAVLDRFAGDTFWGVRVEGAQHPNTSRETLLGLLERDARRRAGHQPPPRLHSMLRLALGRSV